MASAKIPLQGEPDRKESFSAPKEYIEVIK